MKWESGVKSGVRENGVKRVVEGEWGENSG